MPSEFVGVSPHKSSGKATGNTVLLRSFQSTIAGCYWKNWINCYSMGQHYLDRSGTDWYITLADLLNGQRGVADQIQSILRSAVKSALQASGTSSAYTISLLPEWKYGVRPTYTSDWAWAVGHFATTVRGDVWFGPVQPDGNREIQLRYRSFLQDTYDFDGSPFGQYAQLVDQNRASEFRVFGLTKMIVVKTTLKALNADTIPMQW